MPIPIPQEFHETTESWTAQTPQRIFTCESCGGKGQSACRECNGSGKWVCSDCNGTGEWVCNECHGTGRARCERCEGTGKEPEWDRGYEVLGKSGRFSGSKCARCHGETTLPCKSCGGFPKRVCDSCGGTPKQSCRICGGKEMVACEKCSSAGWLAEIPTVEASFTAEESTCSLGEKPGADSAVSVGSEITPAPFLSYMTEKQLLPSVIDALTSSVARGIRQQWKGFIGGLEGRARRMKLEIGLVPCTTCRMRFQARVFDIHIIGQRRQVVPTSGTPKDEAYLKRKVEKNRLEKKLSQCRAAKNRDRRASIVMSIITATLVVLAVGLGAGYVFTRGRMTNAELILALPSTVLLTAGVCLGMFARSAARRARGLDLEYRELQEKIQQIDT